MQKYRVWFHFYRRTGQMSVHFRGRCIQVKNIECQVPVKTKWNKVQPFLVMKGWAKEVRVVEDTAIIS